MSDSAAHLVDEVLPKVPVRQWVCSLPWQLRYDAKLCSAVLAAFMAALRRSLRRRATRLSPMTARGRGEEGEGEAEK